MGVLTPSQKVLFMGLSASGKSSICSLVFEKKSIDEVKDYHATINYIRSTKNIIDSTFQIFDCGGQESFISVFIGEQAEFFFSNVTILIWVVDASNFDAISTSKFYFDQAINRLSEYSRDAVIFCLFHKVDLLSFTMRDNVLQTLESYFITDKKIEIIYRGTSIFDNSIYNTIGDVVRKLISRNTRTQTFNEALQQFIEKDKEILGIIIYTEEGVPIFKEGELSKEIILPASLWLTNYERLKKEINITILKSFLETDEYFFILQKIKSRFLLSVITSKIAPIHYITMKIETIADTLKKLL